MGEHVRAGDLDVWVEQVGEGPDVLLIGGLGDTVESWQFQLDGLAGRYRMTAFDNRGAGRTAMPAGPVSVEQMADDAAEVLRARDIPSAHVAGFSGGSIVSQELALRHPELVRSLVLQSTWPVMDRCLRTWVLFVRWLVDRRSDLEVVTNQVVVDILAKAGIEATTEVPEGVSVEDVLHAPLPNGATPPNRSFTVGDVFTHPGDSYAPEHTGPVLALPLMTPWGSIGGALDFVRRIRPERVIPIHDFYLTSFGREWMVDITAPTLEAEGIEVVALGWGESLTV